MKIVTLIARILLGLVFLVFGLNGFLNFLNTGPAPTGLAGQFLGALILSHYYWVVAALQIAGGALLLANRFVPLASACAGNRKHHLFSCVHESERSTTAAVVTVLWLIVFYRNRQHLSGIFVQRV
jgi:putative oxidoreductase